LFGYNYCQNPDRGYANNKRLSVDSMHEQFNAENTKLDSFLSCRPDSSFFSPQNGILREVYFHSPGPDNPVKYILYTYYKKSLNGIKKSFSRRADNSKEYEVI